MTQVTVELPDEIVSQIESAGDNPGRRLLEAFAIEGYRSQRLTGWQVQNLLGLKDRFEVDRLLKDAGVFEEYTAEELEEDFQNSHRASTEAKLRR